MTRAEALKELDQLSRAMKSGPVSQPEVLCPYGENTRRASKRARTESLGSMMDSYDARSVSLGTHSGICDGSCQSRIGCCPNSVMAFENQWIHEDAASSTVGSLE